MLNEQELLDKCRLTLTEVAKHYKKKHKIGASLELVEIWIDYNSAKLLLDEQLVKAIPLVKKQERERIIKTIEGDIKAGIALGENDGDFMRPYYRTQSFVQTLKTEAEQEGEG